jgi:hypothetical protein
MQIGVQMYVQAFSTPNVTRGLFFVNFVTNNDLGKVKPDSGAEKSEKNYGEIRF